MTPDLGHVVGDVALARVDEAALDAAVGVQLGCRQDPLTVEVAVGNRSVELSGDATVEPVYYIVDRLCLEVNAGEIAELVVVVGGGVRAARLGGPLSHGVVLEGRGAVGQQPVLGVVVAGGGSRTPAAFARCRRARAAQLQSSNLTSHRLSPYGR